VFAKLPSVESNRTALLVTHSSSEDTESAARYAVVQWGSIFAGLGYTVVAHAYDEVDSAYGQFDLQDTLDAIDWLNGAGADVLEVDKVFLQGTSRGGIIAYQAAYRCDPDKLAGVIADRGVSNFLLMQQRYELAAGGGLGSAIQRAAQLTLDWVGALPAEDPQPWIDLSAAYHIDQIGVPMLIIHGDRDSLVPFEQATDFQARVQQAGRSDIEFYLVPGRGHFDLGFDAGYRDAVLDFMQRH
jgi:dipeptidyl aminopeptidase/acylaminoacyl peptidase